VSKLICDPRELSYIKIYIFLTLVEVDQVEPQDLIKIGKIVGTHGYKGTVKVEPLTDFPQRFKEMQSIKISQGNRLNELSVENCSFHKGHILIKFKGIDGMEDASKFRNAYLNVEADELYPLPEGHYYHFQLIGMGVYDTEKGYLGNLTDILETGANDVYVVKTQLYGDVLIPAIKNVIQKVDLAQNRIDVQLLPGLLEVNSGGSNEI